MHAAAAIATHFVAVLAAVLTATAQAAPAPAGRLAGEVLETRQVDGYTYLRLKTASGETWAAVPTTAVAKGARVSIAQPMMMENFASKALGRSFDRIAFGVLDGPDAKTASPHGAGPAATAAPAAAVKVDKAPGPDGRTVAEVVGGKSALQGKVVVVRGQVAKVSNGILGKNWVHLRDGSGSPADGSHDVLVTTQDVGKVGDIVSARGTVRTDVDLGSGYRYAVIIEGAALRK